MICGNVQLSRRRWTVSMSGVHVKWPRVDCDCEHTHYAAMRVLGRPNIFFSGRHCRAEQPERAGKIIVLYAMSPTVCSATELILLFPRSVERQFRKKTATFRFHQVPTITTTSEVIAKLSAQHKFPYLKFYSCQTSRIICFNFRCWQREYIV